MTKGSKMRPSTGLFLGAAAVAATAAAVWTFWPPLSTGRADPEDARQMALGETVYRQHCASCHGAKLEGQANWRIMYYIAPDAVVILDVFKKQTEATPKAVITACQRRLSEFRRLTETTKGAGHAQR